MLEIYPYLGEGNTFEHEGQTCLDLKTVGGRLGLSFERTMYYTLSRSNCAAFVIAPFESKQLLLPVEQLDGWLFHLNAFGYRATSDVRRMVDQHSVHIVRTVVDLMDTHRKAMAEPQGNA